MAFTLGNIVIMNIYYWKKVNIDIPRFWSNIMRMSSTVVISVVFGAIMNHFFLEYSWGLLIIKISIFSVVYIYLLWLFGTNEYEKDLFMKPAKNIISKCRKRMYRVH